MCIRDRPIRSLSGGNIQKVIVAREFKAPSDLLVLNQPTRGVDVGAISFIHSKILEMRSHEKAILLVSADLNELISLSDRILVMHCLLYTSVVCPDAAPGAEHVHDL